MIEVWWRAEDKRCAIFDEWDEGLTGSTLHIQLRPHNVTRHTPKGVFLDTGDFVRGKANKQFAVPTRELALLDLMARKRVQISFCQHRLNRAKEHLEGAERALKNERRNQDPGHPDL